MIKIAIVEDHPLFREGVKNLISKSKDIAVIGEFSNGKEFTDSLSQLDIDIVIMDINMPLMNGIEATRIANNIKPNIKIIVLSMYSDQNYYYEMIKAGIAGFVLKNASTTELEKAIRDVNDGLGFFSPKLLQEAVLKINDEKNKTSECGFSKREIDIIQLLCQGLTNSEISDKLCLSTKTIEFHKSKLLLKTETKNSTGLIIYAIKNKIVQL